LPGQKSLRLRAVPLALAVLLEGVLHAHLLAAQELVVHVLHGHVGCLEVVERDEAVALRVA
jgi:hypothetical protein